MGPGWDSYESRTLADRFSPRAAWVTGSMLHSGYFWSPTGIFYDSSPPSSSHDLQAAMTSPPPAPLSAGMLRPVPHTFPWEGDPFLPPPALHPSTPGLERRGHRPGFVLLMGDGEPMCWSEDPQLRSSGLPWLHLGNREIGLSAD